MARRGLLDAGVILLAVALSAIFFRMPGVAGSIFRDWADDAFFYVIVADSIVEGRGSTADGVGVTNGYHPAWMAVHVGVRMLFDDPLRPLAAVQLGLLAVVMLLLYRLLAERFGPTPGLVGALLASFETSYRRVLGAGMETELAFAALAGTLILLRGARLDALAPGKRRALQLALALLFFTRIDGALFWVALATIALLDGTRPAAIFRLFAPPALLAGAYFAFNAAYFGTAMPISGRVKAMDWARVVAEGPAAYLAQSFDRLVLLFGLRTSKAWEFSIHFPRRDALHAVLWAGYLVLVAAAIAWIARRLARRGELDLAARTLLLGTGLHAAYYAFFQWDDYALSWARGPELLLLTFFGAAAAARLLARPAIGGAAAAVTLVFLVRTADWNARHAGVIRDFNTSESAFRAGVAFVRERTRPGEIIASESIGFLGHFADRPVVSLDGLLNSMDFYRRYLRAGRVGDYLREHGVRYVAQGVRKDVEPIGYMSGVLGIPASRLSVAATFEGGASIPRRYVVLRLD